MFSLLKYYTNRFFKILFGWTSTLIILFVVIGVGIANYWPSSYWLSNVQIVAFDAPLNEDVFMEVNREINRPFVADWSVLVRKQEGYNWEVVCTAHGRGDYRPDAVLPSPMTLDWWTDGQCANPPEGKLFITTIWKIDTDIGTKTVIAQSNVFNVTEIEQTLP